MRRGSIREDHSRKKKYRRLPLSRLLGSATKRTRRVFCPWGVDPNTGVRIGEAKNPGPPAGGDNQRPEESNRQEEDGPQRPEGSPSTQAAVAQAEVEGHGKREEGAEAGLGEHAAGSTGVASSSQVQQGPGLEAQIGSEPTGPANVESARPMVSGSQDQGAVQQGPPAGRRVTSPEDYIER
eukprot:12624581-Heterocapsa_arctica.AAC.2